jgi:sugar O-acyltransferase (sialic acid O-acetyltransferase NeuD family)
MKDIAIFGAGGFGREVYWLIQRLNKREKQWNFLGFYDDEKRDDFGSSKVPFNYLGTIEDLNSYNKSLAVVIAIGKPAPLNKVVNSLINPHLYFPNIIDEDNVFYDHNLTIGHGNVITTGCIFTDNISIGNFNVFNSKITVGHDVIIGSYNIFNPNTAISGNVTINNCNFFGLNSSIIQGKNVGSNNQIGASTLMIRNAKDNENYFGVPGYKSL